MPRTASRTRAKSTGTVGVVDIGSNTVRLVVYDGYLRAPVPMFNESAQCGLGRELANSGALGGAAVESALRAITRYSRLARAMGVEQLTLIATAAVRDASNGRAFAQQVRERCGEPVQILSGEDEARLSALGVMSGIPDAHGIMGDLGGGSLELVDIERGQIKRQATLPVGILRFADRHRLERGAVLEEVRQQCASLDWLPGGAGRSFYPVGGAWRAVARLHMAHTDHPLHVIDGYRMSMREMRDLAAVVTTLGPQSLQRIAGVSKRRRSSLPLACDLMLTMMQETGAEEIVFSAQGLREGFLFSNLSQKEQRRDPALVAAKSLAARDSRFGPIGESLLDWIEPLFKGRNAGRRRLRRIACHLSDIGWRDHPDYRAVQALNRIQRFPFMGLGHDERAFLAYVAYIRYGGGVDAEEAQSVHHLMSNRQTRRAEIIGTAIRLAFRVSGGAASVLERSALIVEDDRLSLRLPDDGSSPLDDTVERRFNAVIAASRMQPGRVIE